MKSAKTFFWAFALKSCGLLFLLILVVSILGSYNTNVGDRRLDALFIGLEHDVSLGKQPDIIFFSNSFIYTSLDPNQIEKETGLKGRHLNTPAQQVFVTPQVVHKTLKTCKPKYAVFDVGPKTLSFPGKDQAWYFNLKAAASLGLSLEKLKMMNEIYDSIPSTSFAWEGFSKLSASFLHLRDIEHYSIKKKSTIPQDLIDAGAFSDSIIREAQKPESNGFLPTPAGFNLPVVKKLSDTAFQRLYSTIQPKENEYFTGPKPERFLNLLKELTEKGIKVILVKSVNIETNQDNAFKEWKVRFKSIDPENILILDFNTLETKKKLNLKKDEFLDMHHVNKSGAEKVTRMFINSIKGF